MKKRNLIIVGTFILIVFFVLFIMSQQKSEEVAPGFSLGEANETIEEEPSDTKPTDEETPTEFQDNLDEAFEDLDAVDL